MKTVGIVNQYLLDNNSAEEMSYDEVIDNSNLTSDIYQQALQECSSSPKIYLQRQPDSININNYNPHLLRAWQANLDLQFVTDPYACIQYVISYITKEEREMGTLLSAVAKESEQETVKEQMKKCGQAFLNSRSVSAQEAVYRALGLPLYKSNFTTVWIPTGLPSERIRLLKPTYVLQNLDDADSDIFISGITDKYSNRPAVLEDWSLTLFASWYETSQRDFDHTDFQPDLLANRFSLTDIPGNILVDNAPDFIRIQLPSSNCIMKKRKRQAVVPYHKFSEQKQPESFYHSQLFLFTPWRAEKDLLQNYTFYEESYNHCKEIIEHNRLPIFQYEQLIESTFEQLQNSDQPTDAWDNLAPANQQNDYDAQEEGALSDDEHAILQPTDNIDIQVQLPTPTDSSVQCLSIDTMPSPLPYSDFC